MMMKKAKAAGMMKKAKMAKGKMKGSTGGRDNKVVVVFNKATVGDFVVQDDSYVLKPVATDATLWTVTTRFLTINYSSKAESVKFIIKEGTFNFEWVYKIRKGDDKFFDLATDSKYNLPKEVKVKDA